MAEEIVFKIGDQLSVDQAMQLAISEARKGAPFVSPNPLVGCVILDQNQCLLATGYHKKYGTDHAEVDAFKKLTTDQLQKAIFVVTLEPCAHEGKTPSCAKALAKMPIQKVIYGLQDPNPLVSGQGALILKEAGKAVELYQGAFSEQLEVLAEIFLKNFRLKKTFVAAKVASSLDGQIALQTGQSQWITTEQSREYVHELRSYYDAILVGRRTIELDNPSLNIRNPQFYKENKVVVIDPQGKIIQKIAAGQNFKFLTVHKDENIIFAVNKKLQSSFTQVEFSSLEDLLNKLYNLKIMSLFIEGGAETYSQFLAADLIDRLYLFMNASIIGSSNGLSWTKNFGSTDLKAKKRLQNLEFKNFGADLFITGRLKS